MQQVADEEVLCIEAFSMKNIEDQSLHCTKTWTWEPWQSWDWLLYLRPVLNMMKPLPCDAKYPKEFFVQDLEYFPRTIYHIIRRTLWLVKGHSPAVKLEGAMKTLVFYIFNGINFNAQDFFI